MDIKKLVLELKNYDYHYSIGNPLITDLQYDIVVDKLYKLEPTNNYFKLIGFQTINDQILLPFYLGSLNKIKDNKKLLTWINTYNTSNFIISEKLDGISALYIVKEHKLYTRGNGIFGSDISHILDYINLPKLDDNILSVRGELIIPKTKWCVEYGSNGRNVVAGTIRNKIINVKLLNIIDFVIYQVMESNIKNIKIENQLDMIKYNCVNYKKESNLNFDNLKNTLINYKTNSKYEIDGIVITDNSKTYDNIKTGNPTFAFAFKNSELDESALTTVIGVEYKLSKDNRYKPRVLFEPIQLDNVNIECASGYNAKFIKENGIGIGTKLIIKRSGQVIPKIISIIEKKQPKLPIGNWIWDETLTDAIYNDNKLSKEQSISRSTYFFKKLNIKFISEGTITKLYDNNFKTLDDILDIDNKIQLHNIKGFGIQKINIIFENIQSVKVNTPINELMTASNIFDRSLGSKKLNTIFENYPNVLNIDVSILDLVKINGIGEINAKQFNKDINNFRDFYKKYFTNSIINEESIIDYSINTKLIQKNIVFSGIRDKLLETKIIKNGGKISLMVTKKTDILIIKDINANSTNIKKAKEFNVLILNYNDIL